MRTLEQVHEWGAEHVAAGVVTAERVLAEEGTRNHVFRWASITKLLTAVAVLVAAEEGVLDLEDAAGPDGSTVRHLLAHASGLPFEAGAPIAAPGQRRIYSSQGYDVLGAHLASRAGMPFGDYLAEAVLKPLGLDGIELRGSPAEGAWGPLGDLLRFGGELLAPTLLAPETVAEATTVVFPDLAGVLPGFGRQEPNDWGLGFEVKDEKAPHWTGRRNSSRTFGHFGGSGTFLWVDPDSGIACGCLSDREFGDWAVEAWPRLSDAVLAEISRW